MRLIRDEPVENDFSEYLWMGEEILDEFDRKFVEELEEESDIQEEYEKFLQQQIVYYIDFVLDDDDGVALSDVLDFLDSINLQEFSNCHNNSILNPEAPEFIPRNRKESSSSNSEEEEEFVDR